MALVYYGGEPSDVAMIGSRVVTGRPAVVWSDRQKSSRLTAPQVVDSGDGSSVASGTVNGVVYSAGVVYPNEDGVYAYAIEDGPGSTWLEVHSTDRLLRMVGFSSDGYIVVGGGSTSVGPTGPGVATGGTTGQFLRKSSATNFDTAWAALPNDLPSGGTTGQALTKTSGTDYAVGWTTVPADAAVVKLTGNQTVAGDKTFTGNTTVQTPTLPGHAATKAYADALVALFALNGYQLVISPNEPAHVAGLVWLKNG